MSYSKGAKFCNNVLGNFITPHTHGFNDRVTNFASQTLLFA